MTDSIEKSEITEFWMCKICAICYIDENSMWEHVKSCGMLRRKVASIKRDTNQQISRYKNESTNAESESETCPISDTHIKAESQSVITPLSTEVIIKNETETSNVATKKYNFRPRALKMSTEDEQNTDMKEEPNTPTKLVRGHKSLGQKKVITSSKKDFSGPGASETKTRRHRGRPLQGELASISSGQFSCSYCSKRFATRFQLEQHQRIHTGRKPYKCSHCHKSFAQKTSLNNHVRTHTGERPFECRICKRAFTQVTNLIFHERIHNNIKPYECAICGKAFAQIANRDAHVKRHG